MALFTSDESEGGTIGELIAVAGIICFAFSWIPIFIIWKLFSTYRRRTRSQEQDSEAGNMPVQTNPSKPNRSSWKPPPQMHQDTELVDISQLSPAAQDQESTQRDLQDKRRPMPTQPTDPRIRMLPDVDDTATEWQNHKFGQMRNERFHSRPFQQPDQPARAAMRHPSQQFDHEMDESPGAPGPSSRVPRNSKRSAQEPR